MNKFKVINGTGLEKFQSALNEWSAENKEKTVLGISHSSVELTLPVGGGQMMKGYDFSAIIWYEDQEETGSFKRPRTI